MFGIHPMFLVGGASQAQAAYADYDFQVVNQQTYTFTGIDIGAASSDRHVVVIIGGGANSRTVSSVTVNGQPCTVVATTTFSVRDAGMAITDSPVTSGTTATIVVTWSGSNNRCHIGTYAVTGLQSTTPTDTGIDSGTGTPSNRSTTLDISAGGIGIGLFVNSSGSAGSTTWGGLTEDFDLAGDGTICFSGASLESSSAQTGLSITADGSSVCILIAASWR
jgi:hypothetical protein